jgi:hypothetical protein
MAWKMLKGLVPKLPSLTWRPSRQVLSRVVLGALLAGALVGTYFWGRNSAMHDSRLTELMARVPNFMNTSQGSGAKEVVADLCDGQVVVTRRELGDYLVDRLGGERVDFLINRKIIDLACQAQGIKISDAEIKAQFDEDLKGFGCTEDQFVRNILRKYNKSLFEYKEDVIRPKLALQQFCRERVRKSIGEDDLKNAFEAKFGEKVQVRLIVLMQQQAKDGVTLWNRIKDSVNPAEEFDREAKKQSIPKLAAEGGRVPAVHHHFGSKEIEEEAFKLQPGQMSSLMPMPDGTSMIMWCDSRIPPERRIFEEVREELYRDLFEMRLPVEMQKVFDELRRQASPRVYLPRELSSAAPSGPIAAQAQPAPVVPTQPKEPLPGLPPGH